MSETISQEPLSPKETLSRAEEQFEDVRKLAGWIVAPLIFLTLLFIPMPGLSPAAHKLAAIMGLVGVLWITETLPLAITGLLAPVLVIVLGVAPANQAFTAFADPLMFLFLGAFITTKAICLHGLDRRFAYLVLANPLIGESPSRILFAYGAVCCLISMWISNTATAAMMFPIGVAIIRTLDSIKGASIGKAYPCAIMLICAFGSSVGGLATPVGTPTNLIGLGFIEKQLLRKITFFEWMSFAIPIVIVMYLILFTYLNFLCSPKIKKLSGIKEQFLEEKNKLGKLSRGELNVIIAFGITVLLWITPGILAIALGDTNPATISFSKHVPESVAALIGACLLFLLPINWKKQEFTISLEQALKIDWAVMALYGGGIMLGQLAFSTKLAESIGVSLSSFIPSSGVGLVATTSIVAVMVSELTSNVSSANMVVPVVIAIAGSGALQSAIAASMASSLGFMLPISTPTNAIVYSSGYVPIKSMIKYGILLDILGFIVILLGTILLVPVK